MLLELQPAGRQQEELDFGSDEGCANRDRLMGAVDRVNDRFGRGTVTLASGQIGETPRDWRMRQERKTPNYTTDWNEMPTVKA